jgi:hypothetical protein
MAMPGLILFLQWFFKWLFNVQFTGWEISIASIGFAQFFPYIFHDNLMTLKVISLATSTHQNDSSLSNTYTFKVNKDNDKIGALKNLTAIMFILILVLFIITLGVSYKLPTSYVQYWTGILCAVFSWLYVIFA